MARQETKESPQSSGVDALIAKLRDEGVTAGREEADALLAEARAQAKRILDKANNDAQQHLEEARKQSEAYRNAGKEALKTAMRDTVLEMKNRMLDRFSNDVKRLVSHQLQDENVLKQMIIEVAGRVRADSHIDAEDAVETILPREVVGLEELRSRPEELREGTMTKLVLGLTGEMLRDGMTFSASDDEKVGIRFYMKGKDIALDMTDEAVAALLLQHLQPRFRAILEGIIK